MQSVEESLHLFEQWPDWEQRAAVEFIENYLQRQFAELADAEGLDIRAEYFESISEVSFED
jgi:hypothetical protein